ncbi:MAG: tetratricopeptide repeat protein [Alkalinema sp. RU_4_3]|nr:tetratricopeptide repeat protein [Alkalinema sp. RU_4_3]
MNNLRTFPRNRYFPIALSLLATIAILLIVRGSQTPLSKPRSLNPRQASLQKELAFYQAKVQQNPTSGLELAALAAAYWRLGKATGDVSWYLLAEQTANRSIAQSPVAKDSASLILAQVAQAKHDFKQAESIAKTVLQTKPNSDEAKSILITCYLATGRLKEAEVLVKPLVDKLPNLGNFTLQGLVEDAQGKTSAAKTFQFGLEVEERGEEAASAQTRVLLGRHFYHHGQIDRAHELYTKALTLVPNYPLALLYLAALETQRGNYDQANRYYNQLAEDHKGTPNVYDHTILRGQARIKQLQNQSPDALLQQAENLLRQDSEFGHRRELAQLLLDRAQNQDVKEALTLMEAEVKVRQDATTMAVFARALRLNNRLPEAREAMKQALNSGIQQVSFFQQAAQIEQALGNSNGANAYQTKAKQLDPTFDAAKQLSLDTL